MGRSGLHAATVVATIAIALSPCVALARVSPGDATATRSYLLEDYAAMRAELKDFPAALAAIEALGTRLHAECPGVLANAPKPARGATPNSTEVEIGKEESDAAFGVAEHTEYRRSRGFARAVARLRWSNRALTRLVHLHAAEEVAKAEVPPPELCADMRAWVSSGYQTVSAATESYLRRESALSKTEGAEEVIMRRLARYENRADRRIARQIAGLEKSALPALLTKVFAALGKVSEALHTAAAVPAA